MLTPFVDCIREWRDEGYKLTLICHSVSEAQKLIELLEEYGLTACLLEAKGLEVLDLSPVEVPVQIQIADFTRGFRFPLMRLIVITEEELFGEKKK